MDRPRLKTVFSPISVDTRTVCLGLPRTPRSATIADPTGGIRAVLALLDGSRSVEDLACEVSPLVCRDDVESLLRALAANGYLEDAAMASPTDLSDRELRRYSRNSEFFSYFSDAGPAGPPTRYAPQVALKAATVTVLGVGGLGSHVAVHLVALGVGRLHLVDYDLVEESNLNRQLLFTDADIGRPKVLAAADRLLQVNPLVEVLTTEARIAGPADVEQFLAGADLTICAADRPRVDLDRWINAAALEGHRPWMRGASVGLTAVLDLFVPGLTACAECRLQPANDSDPSDSDPNDSDPSDSGFLIEQLRSLGDITVSPCISPVAGLLGSFAALEALKFLTGMTATPLLDNQLVIDLPNAEVHHLPDPPSASCPACGTASNRERRARDHATAARP